MRDRVWIQATAVLRLSHRPPPPALIVCYPAHKTTVCVQGIIEPSIACSQVYAFSFGERHIDAIVGALVVLLGNLEGSRGDRRNVQQPKG